MGIFRKERHHRAFISKIFMFSVLVALMVIMLWIRVFYGSMESYHQGEEYLRESQYIKAITFFDRSIHWYTPFNPYAGRSAEKLWEIGDFAEAQGDIRLALIAYRTIRRGFYAARSFFSPGKKWIHRSDRKINALIQLEQDQKKLHDGPASEKKSFSESQKAPGPNVLWSIILGIGFLGWVGSVFGFIVFKCRDTQMTRFFGLSCLKWGCPALIFFIFWIIAMVKA